MSFHLFNKKSKEELFWKWFAANSDRYYHLENNQGQLMDELKNELNKMDTNLTFEFGPVVDGYRELVISADGIKKTFPAVQKLIDCAPEVPNWRFIAFRQPMKNLYKDMKIEFPSGLSLCYSDVYFRYAKDSSKKGKIGIELNIKGYYESKEWGMLVFIMLDSILGEYETEMAISWIDKKPLDEEEINNFWPITDLPAIVKKYKQELNN